MAHDGDAVLRLANVDLEHPDLPRDGRVERTTAVVWELVFDDPTAVEDELVVGGSGGTGSGEHDDCRDEQQESTNQAGGFHGRKDSHQARIRRSASRTSPI